MVSAVGNKPRGRGMAEATAGKQDCEVKYVRTRVKAKKQDYVVGFLLGFLEERRSRSHCYVYSDDAAAVPCSLLFGRNSSSASFGVMSQNQQRSVDVRGRVVMVNGSNRGIGRAILEGFLQRGASKAYAAARSVTSVEDLVERYGRDRVIPIRLDVTDQSSIDEAAAIAQDVDVVVNNAGILDLIEPLGEQSHEFVASLQRQMDVNVLGLVRMSLAFLPILEKKSGGGAFVQINSTSSLRCPGAHFTGYAASKAAAYSIVQGLRSSTHNTLIVSVHPGPIATDMVDQFGARDRSEPAEQVAEAIVEALKEGSFLVFPDTISKKIGEAYMPYAEAIVLPTTKHPSTPSPDDK